MTNEVIVSASELLKVYATAVDEALARIAELEAVLKPFADMAMSAAPASDGDTFIVGIPKASDLRAARAALEKKND